MAKEYRVKCSCGKVMNATPGSVCSDCKQSVVFPAGGQVYLYRMGNFLGAGGGIGLYIDGEPYGHIGNRETLCIPLPYGPHNFHVAVGMSRKCQDLVINITPENPIAYAKFFMKPGFWTNSFVIEPTTKEDLGL